jgi:hypothetical protein
MAYVPELKSLENTYFSELNESDTKKSFPYIKVGLIVLTAGLIYYYREDIKKFFGKAKEKYQNVKSKTSGGGLITIKPSSMGMFLSALVPYIVIGGIIYYYRKDIKKLLPFNINPEEVEQAKKKLSDEIKKEGLLKTGANILKGFAYTIYEPQYKDAQYFKNQQWIMDLKKGWKTKEQVLNEIKATGYKVLPELDKLLRSK